MENNINSDLYDLLVTQNFDPELLDASGKSVTDPSEAELFSFDWKTDTHNYGTVVVLIGQDNNLDVYFGDNLGRTMESDDKKQWYDFLLQMKNFATRHNFHSFKPQNLNRLKYTMQGIAAIKEGLFEGYYGTRKVSYNDRPKNTRIVIKHSKQLSEGDARFRNIEAIFIENASGERFRLRTNKLLEARAQARHVSEGGNPYDPLGQHISTLVEELVVLNRFRRASQGRVFKGATAKLVERANEHYTALHHQLKSIAGQRGYQQFHESWNPSVITEQETTVDEIKTMFIENSLDSRIEDALPILAKLQETTMKEVTEFESWMNQLTEEATDPAKELEHLMASELIVGVDAVDAKEQLFDVVNDEELNSILTQLADENPDANIWDDGRVLNRLSELGFDVSSKQNAAPPENNEAPPEAQDEEPPEPAPNTDSDQFPIPENLDADGVLMTKPSNMSSESMEMDSLKRIVELAKK